MIINPQDGFSGFLGNVTAIQGMREMLNYANAGQHCVVSIGRCMYDSQCFEANQWIPQKCAGDVGFHKDPQDFREIIWKLIFYT